MDKGKKEAVQTFLMSLIAAMMGAGVTFAALKGGEPEVMGRPSFEIAICTGILFLLFILSLVAGPIGKRLKRLF